MGRLSPVALIGNEVLNLHYVHDSLAGEISSQYALSESPNAWSKVAENARRLDPDGSKAIKLFNELYSNSSR